MVLIVLVLLTESVKVMLQIYRKTRIQVKNLEH